MVGTVIEIGPLVKSVKIGDDVAVGCIIDACLRCDMCQQGKENYCKNGGPTHAYNSLKNHGHIHGNLSV